MNLFVLDENFQNLALVDAFESLIWTDRYNTYGDFELYLPASNEAVSLYKRDRYLWSSESEHLMIIEGQELTTDLEDGNKLIVTGRSLESLLDRRIVWDQTNFSGRIQAVIKKMISDAFISPAIAARKIPNFVFADSSDSTIAGVSVEIQCTGDNIYDVVTKLLAEHQIGYKITLNNSNQFVFQLYVGSDRSYDQTQNPYVLFSPKFENIIESNYIESSAEHKNVALVAGEGEGSARQTTIVPTANQPSGLLRRETYVDARDLQNSTAAQRTQRGQNALKEAEVAKAFEGQVETTRMYRYNEDFYLGDIVQLINEYGMESRTRISEMVISQDENGFSVYPTFSVI